MHTEPTPKHQEPATETELTVYVVLHTSNTPEQYDGFVIPVKASPEHFETLLRTAGGGTESELFAKFTYRKTASNEISLYVYTYYDNSGNLTYDIGWLESLISEAEGV